MTTATATRKPTTKTAPAPATGCVRWIERLNSETHGFGIIRITSQTKAGAVVNDYEIAAIYDKKGQAGIYDPKSKLVGWKLFKLNGEGDGEAYTLDLDAGLCDCKDAMHRRAGACKHVLATRAAFKALLQPTCKAV